MFGGDDLCGGSDVSSLVISAAFGDPADCDGVACKLPWIKISKRLYALILRQSVRMDLNPLILL